jgi:hypothetical protein
MCFSLSEYENTEKVRFNVGLLPPVDAGSVYISYRADCQKTNECTALTATQEDTANEYRVGALIRPTDLQQSGRCLIAEMKKAAHGDMSRPMGRGIEIFRSILTGGFPYTIPPCGMSSVFLIT